MKLIELEPYFLKVITETHFRRVRSIKKADGITFLCPACFKNNGNSNIGVHSVMCWQPNVPQSIHPTPGRWNFIGTSLKDLELKNGSSSILLHGGCNAHFWIRNGEIIFC